MTSKASAILFPLVFIAACKDEVKTTSTTPPASASPQAPNAASPSPGPQDTSNPPDPSAPSPSSSFPDGGLALNLLSFGIDYTTPGDPSDVNLLLRFEMRLSAAETQALPERVYYNFYTPGLGQELLPWTDLSVERSAMQAGNFQKKFIQENAKILERHFDALTLVVRAEPKSNSKIFYFLNLSSLCQSNPSSFRNLSGDVACNDPMLGKPDDLPATPKRFPLYLTEKLKSDGQTYCKLAPELNPDAKGEINLSAKLCAMPLFRGYTLVSENESFIVNRAALRDALGGMMNTVKNLDDKARVYGLIKHFDEDSAFFYDTSFRLIYSNLSSAAATNANDNYGTWAKRLNDFWRSKQI